MLQNTAARSKIAIVDGWLMCPCCGRGKVQKLLPDTEVKNLVVFCKLCKTESVVNIESQCQCLSASASAS